MISDKNPAAAKEIRNAKEMARVVIAHHFGNKKPRRILHKTSGLSNFVFEVLHAEGDFIVRISPDQTRINSFIKEQWAQNKAREIGVPIPEILEVGSHVINQPFMISRVVEGSNALTHRKRLEIVKEMGRYAALINTIKTEGFGATFDWSSNLLSRNETWQDFLESELKFEEKLQTLEKRKMLDATKAKKIRKILTDAAKQKEKPALNHGDIRLKNVMVDDDGRITAFLDWENCTSNLAPVWELSIALHDLSIDEKQLFLEGYGLKEKEIVTLMPVIKAINFINYAPEVERLAMEKDTEHLEKLRTRLGGALDFYSFC
jgi:aminoglycoside phosphotransferase (APT) family kinase protein